MTIYARLARLIRLARLAEKRGRHITARKLRRRANSLANEAAMAQVVGEIDTPMYGECQ